MKKIIPYFYLLVLNLSSILSAHAQLSFPNQMTLFFTPTPYGLKWETPRDLAQSAILNKLFSSTNRPIGHVSIRLECTSPQQEEKLFFHTGMVAKKLNAPELLLTKHMGFGILFHTFEGRLETAEELEEEVARRLKEQSLNFLSFPIEYTRCQRIYKYYQEFKEKNLDFGYGLANRPRYKEGSGCSAFAASFLEVSGLMTDEYRKAWTRTLNIPKTLIGDQNHPVFLYKLLLPWAKLEWSATPQPNTKNLTFWDPELMYQWVEQRKNSSEPILEKVRIHGTIGLRLKQVDGFVPNELFWLKE